MTDAAVAEAAPAEAVAPAAEPATTGEKAKRGRPRPESTIDRDKTVFEALTGPKTRGELVDALGLKPNEVYLSLYRLHTAGKIKRTREGAKHIWTAVEA